MINKLRKKFIAVSMISVLIVLTILIGVINAVTYHNIVSDADNVLKMIADNGGSMPGPEERDENGPSGDLSDKAGTSGPQNEDETGGGDKKPEPPDGVRPDDSDMHRRAEMVFDTRYFTVTFDDAGKVESSDTSRVAAISEEEAESIASEIYSSGSLRGFSGNYRYLRNDSQIICVDCYRSIGNFRSFMLASIGVSVIGLIAVLILVVLFSGHVVKPVAESYEKQKQFITDAGHELKTPLSVIDADVSVIEMEGGGSEWLNDIKTQTKRLAGLTNELVYLSKMDEGRKPARLPFPLSDVVAEEVTSFEGRAKIEEKVLISEIGKDISYDGDEKMIRELVSILMDNAVKYSDEHGTIRVGLSPDGKGAVLSVANTVDHIDQEQTAHMFDRFYRADQSRSEKSGYGLGLSIARAVCESHGGSIKAEAGNGGRMITITARLA